ncbi:flagellar hook-basal body complex protein [Pyruvatibacter sp.]|uniref:flagellar hook protein FlgE n=1 Tax=Pyruvatibacter sp. TaxID=1981328 RepID=UPI0032EEF2A7
MTIFGAMTTAITGLKANSKALGHISDNIANTQTIGFKRTETNFRDLVTFATSRNNAPGTVLAEARFTNTVQGALEAAQVPTHMAINGDGYFMVSERVATLDNSPVFNQIDYYTRRGDFEVDRFGYLQNGAGYYLQGVEINPLTGNKVGDVPTRIQIESDFVSARQSTTMEYTANLASFPKTVVADANTPNSELMLDATFTNNPSTFGGDGFVQGQDEQLFLDRSLAGGAITMYDAIGNPVNVEMRWAKVNNTGNGAAQAGGADTWNLFYQTSTTATGATAKWNNVGQAYVFNGSGVATPAVTSATVTGLTVDGVNLGNITLNHGSNQITQFADTNGSVSVTEIEQDGFASGALASIAISDAGRVVGTYTNGKQLDLAEVTLVKFNADNKLRKLDGGAWAATQDSGEAIQGASGEIVAEAREASNVDIADEFSKLIITQQAYSATTRIVTTSDELVRETLNMKR